MKILFFVLSLFPILLTAQRSEVLPARSNTVALPALNKTFRTPPIDLVAINLEDAVEDLQNMPKRFAWPFPVDLGFKEGKWTELPNGDRVWRLRITALGAQAITLLYDKFYLPPGATLHLRSPLTNETLGAFTEKNNNKVGRFATAPITGEVTELEYYEPAAQRGRGVINVSQVGHAYRLMGEEKGLNDAGPCQVNINCEEGNDWQNEKRGVARYFVNGTATCSGTLVNNTAENGTPYFLTADHCIGGLDALGDVDASGYLFYWNYERSGCENSGAVAENTTAGATLVANNEDADFALFRLTESPNPDFIPYYNGWSAEQATSTGGVGIHHPRLDAKKIATHNYTPTDDDGDSNYWTLFWSSTTNGHSVTEGGSSGSGLWNTDHRLVGQLLGGSALNCDDPANDRGVYGKFAWSWEGGGTNNPGRKLQPWLDPANTGAIVQDGAYIDPPPPSVGFLTAVSFNGTEYRENEGTDILPGDCRTYTDHVFPVGPSYELTDAFDVDLQVTGGEASLGRDFTISPTSFTLQPGEISVPVTVRIFDDADIEGPEDIRITLSGSGAGETTVGVNNLLDLTIADDDAPFSGNVSFVAFSDDFEDGLGAWAVTDGGSTDDTWMDVDVYSGGSLNGTRFAITDSDAPGDGNTLDETMTSPSVNLAGAAFIFLRFDQYFRTYVFGGNERGTVEVFDGSNWVNVYLTEESDGDQGSWELPQQVELDLSDYANADFQVRFNFQAGYDWWWAIDNVEIVSSQPAEVTDAVTIAPIEVYIGPFSSVALSDPLTRKLIVEIKNMSSSDFGCTDVYVDRVRDGQDVYPLYSDDLTQGVMARAIRIVPQNPAVSGAYRLRLFADGEDITSWETATSSLVDDAGMYRLRDVSVPEVNVANYAAQQVDWYSLDRGQLGELTYLEAIINDGFGGIAIGQQFMTLPVSWQRFTGRTLSDKANLLDWETAREENNDRFEVEHSTDGGAFTRIGTVAAATTTPLSATEGGVYSFRHDAPAAGDNFYRLRQVDYDGAFSFSEVLLLSNEKEEELGRVLVSPASAEGLRLGLREDVSEVALFDASGRLIVRRSVVPGRSSSVLDLGLPAGVTAGIYFVRFTSGGEQLTRRAVLR